MSEKSVRLRRRWGCSSGRVRAYNAGAGNFICQRGKDKKCYVELNQQMIMTLSVGPRLFGRAQHTFFVNLLSHQKGHNLS